MSRWMEFPIGTTAVPIDLTLNVSAGGLTGETPTIKIRRAVDNYYLDFNDNQFKLSGHTIISINLLDQGDGRYRYLWDSSVPVVTVGSYIVEFLNGGVTVPGVDNDTITFRNLEQVVQSNNLLLKQLLQSGNVVDAGDGTGACKFTYVVKNQVNSIPIEFVKVRVTSDAAGLNTIAGPKSTSISGKVEFYLNSGNTYYFWRSKGGYSFSNPDIQSF